MNNQATKKPRTLSEVRINRPGLFDVICGRGRPYQEHRGNIRLHEIVALHRSSYFNSKRSDKKGVAKMIVNAIKNDETQPGRFLKRIDDENDMVWEDVSDEVAREKVSHVLRFKYKTPQPTSASSSESGASGILEMNNQSSLQGYQSYPAAGHESSCWSSRTLPAFALPIASSYASANQPSRGNLDGQRTLLNIQRLLGGCDTIGWATVLGTATCGTVGTAGAPGNVSETSTGVKLLSDEQVFLMEAMIQTRRARTNTPPGIARPAARYP
jgi:hypothetical protein